MRRSSASDRHSSPADSGTRGRVAWAVAVDWLVGMKVKQSTGVNSDTSRPSTQECVDLLAARQTDAIFTDTFILYGFMQANPGKYRVVMSGAFGTLQYYGIGMLGSHPDECRKLNGIIKDYLRVQWRIDFMAHLPLAVQAAAQDPRAGGFESRFKPTEATMQRLARKVAKEPARPK